MKRSVFSIRSGVKAYFAVFLVLLVLNGISVCNAHVWDSFLSSGFTRLFHFDGEQNLPTLFAVFLLLQASLISFLIGVFQDSKGGAWLVIGAAFAFLGIDEFASLHEQLIGPSQEMFSTSGFFHFAWIIPYGLVVLALAAWLLPWLLRLPKPTRNGLIISALFYLSGVILMEGLAGWYIQDDPLHRGLTFDLMVTIEESFEFIGLITFFYVAGLYLVKNTRLKLIELRK